MASGPITSWEIDGGTVETVADFIFLGSKITAEGDCSHEIRKIVCYFLLVLIISYNNCVIQIISPLEMATHSSILAWRIPWMEEPGGLQSTGSQRVRHN